MDGLGTSVDHPWRVLEFTHLVMQIPRLNFCKFTGCTWSLQSAGCSLTKRSKRSVGKCAPVTHFAIWESYANGANGHMGRKPTSIKRHKMSRFRSQKMTTSSGIRYAPLKSSSRSAQFCCKIPITTSKVGLSMSIRLINLSWVCTGSERWKTEMRKKYLTSSSQSRTLKSNSKCDDKAWRIP